MVLAVPQSHILDRWPLCYGYFSLRDGARDVGDYQIAARLTTMDYLLFELFLVPFKCQRDFPQLLSILLSHHFQLVGVQGMQTRFLFA